ncbi:transcriptional regulator [Lactobacillus sp. PV037]|uniref:YlxM family DNA-binding protein n=1 Tax=Lactobacillus sp. PV037 TaxID=2594496 RepID=UPI0022402A55|nr:transcriptional regulator [Lactobacillus sp. PV037]QNQ83859.1 transcriptional regulator [Lactobacillus sp. PV037]
MDELEKNEMLASLYAYYGELLTKGQQNYFEDYYYNDLSLGEIAENHSVSRQAVYDNLKRSSKALKKYEDTLHLQKEYVETGKLVSQISIDLKSNKKEQAEKNLEKLLRKLGV